MKYLLIILLLVGTIAFGQTTYFIRADSTKLEKVGGNNDLILKNSTRSRTGAYLKNISNGITGFFYAVDSAWMATDSTLVVRRGDGNDTLLIKGSGISTTPGIDDVLAVGQSLTAPRDINLGGGNLFRFYNDATRYFAYDGYSLNIRTLGSGGGKFDWQLYNGLNTTQIIATDGEVLLYTENVSAGNLRAKVRTNQDIAEIIVNKSPDQASATAFYDGAVLRAGLTIHPGNSINYGVDVDNVTRSVKMGTAIGINNNNYRGIRVDSLWQVYLDSIVAGASTDSVLVMTASTGQVKYRNASAFGGGGSTYYNSNVGSGYRWAIPNTNNIKTFTASNGLTLDSATSNQIGIKQGGSLIQSTAITNAGGFDYRLTLDEDNGTNGFIGKDYNGLVGFNLGNAEMSESNAGFAGLVQVGYGSILSQVSFTGGVSSNIQIDADKITLAPFTGALIIDTLNAFSDTTNWKPMVYRTSTGEVKKATYWPVGSGGGGSTSPAGNFGNLQINRNGAFATPGSDSLDFESATGLTVKGNITSSTLTPASIVYAGTGGLLTTDATFTKAGGPFNNEIIVTSSGGAGAGIARYAALTDDPGSYSGLRMGTDANALAGFVITNGSTNSGYGGVYSLNIINNVGYPIDLIQGSTIRLDIATGGAVTISNLAGTGSRTVLADANGLLSAPVSDRRVKYNINGLNDGISTIMKLKPVTFYYKKEWENYGTRRQVGFIAQDVEKVMPNSVFTSKPKEGSNEPGLMGYNEQDIIPVLVKAVQELKIENDKLKARIIKLEKK